MTEETPKPPKFRQDGALDGRGHGDGSVSTRFATGDGRRRPGRPKGSRSLKSIYLAAADMPMNVTINGKRRRITTKEAIVLKLREKALAGHDRAMDRFLNQVEEYSPVEAQPDLTAKAMAQSHEIIAQAVARGLLPAPPLPSEDVGGSEDNEAEAG